MRNLLASAKKRVEFHGRHPLVRNTSRRPPAALVAIGILMATLGLGVLLYQALSDNSGAATAQAVQDSAPHAD